nr:hypothetical protein [Tanacetum cinerariifolium]
VEYPVLRFRLELVVSNETGYVVVAMFDETASELVKCSADLIAQDEEELRAHIRRFSSVPTLVSKKSTDMTSLVTFATLQSRASSLSTGISTSSKIRVDEMLDMYSLFGSSSRNKPELDDAACAKIVFWNDTFSADMCSLGDAALQEMVFLDDVPAPDMIAGFCFSTDMCLFADVASRVIDDLIAFSGESSVPYYMSFFLDQKIAESHRFVTRWREEVDRIRGCVC